MSGLPRSQETKLRGSEPTPLRFVAVIRTGRNANGFSRDGGRVVHAVPLQQNESRLNDGSARPALCGAQPQGIAYWNMASLPAVTCPRCLRKVQP
jgi:hypothetical protein